MSRTQATDGVPTYLGKGDPAGRFADYYPAWVDKLAGDVTLDESMLDGALQGPDAIRAVIGGVRELYDRQDGVLPLGHLQRRWADATHRSHYRPLSPLMFFSRLLRERFAGTPYAECFLGGEA